MTFTSDLEGDPSSTLSMRAKGINLAAESCSVPFGSFIAASWCKDTNSTSIFLKTAWKSFSKPDNDSF